MKVPSLSKRAILTGAWRGIQLWINYQVISWCYTAYFMLYRGRCGRACALGTEAPPRAPEQDAQRTAEHAAQMGEVRHALLSAGHAEEQLEQAVHRHEQPRGHRNGRKQQDDALPGEIPGKGEQH